MRTQRPATLAEEMGLGPKKTFAVIFIVVGCIAILIPKIFYPMMVGPAVGKDARPSSEYFFFFCLVGVCLLRRSNKLMTFL